MANNDIFSTTINFGNEENNNKNKNGGGKTGLLVLAAVVFIGIVLLLAIILIFKPKGPAKQNIVNEYNEVTANFITQEISNETVIDNPAETFDRRYGKVEVVFLDANDNMIDIPAKPKLGDLKPVKYDDSSRQFIDVDPKDPSWYDYANRRWANAINSDGSYFVWIPRFAYKITYYSSSSYTTAIGYCDSRGLLKVDQTQMDGKSLIRVQSNSVAIKEIGNHYMLATSFMRDALNNYENGGWDVSIDGFWVAKYEMSQEKNNLPVQVSDSNIGNVKVDSNVKAVSKPGLNSWRCISVGNAYYNGLNYDKDKQSHLIKNSEWAAVCYLADSQFGTNGEAIQKNDAFEFLTGGAANTTQIYANNIRQSSTFNPTGVYDLSGGAREFVASFIDNGFSYISEYGGTDKDMMYETKTSSKFKTIYPHIPEDVGQVGTYGSNLATGNYKLLADRRGDAMYEVSNTGIGATAWFTSNSYMVQSDVPFMLRSVSAMDTLGTGSFAFNTTIGQPNTTDGYRVCLVVQ